jgi:hypothetical protein
MVNVISGIWGINILAGLLTNVFSFKSLSTVTMPTVTIPSENRYFAYSREPGLYQRMKTAIDQVIFAAMDEMCRVIA